MSLDRQSQLGGVDQELPDGIIMKALQLATGGADGSVTSVRLQFTSNEFLGDLKYKENHYHGGYQPGWKPSRRCAAIDFGRLSSNFRGRDQELKQIEDVLVAQKGHFRHAIYGISGIGKSHVALKYGKRAYESKKYTHVFWISADTEAKLLIGLESILLKLDHRAQLEKDQKAKVEIARRWLEDAEEDQRWLLVLDNVKQESFQNIRDKLPNNPLNGHILLTTQFRTVAEDFVQSRPREPPAILLLQSLSVDDGVALLIASSKTLQSEFCDLEKAQELIQRIGCHPLAITFAAACAESAGSLTELLDWTSDDQLDMITQYEDELAEFDQRVLKVFFDRQVASIQNEPLALEIFRTMSFLDANSISVKMIWRGIVHIEAEDPIQPPPIFKCQKSQLSECVQKLARLNLLEVARPGVVVMHDLTNHLNLRSMEDTNVKSIHQDVAFRLISSSFDSIQNPSHRDNWLASDDVIPHFVKLSSDTDSLNLSHDTSLHNAALYLLNRGRYSGSQNLFNRISITRKRILGPKDQGTLSTMGILAMLHGQLGQYQEAETLYKHVLAEESTQGEAQSYNCIITKHNLATVYKYQCRHKDAEKLLLEVLDALEKQPVSDSNHDNILLVKQNLAGVYGNQGRKREAEEIYDFVLKEHKDRLGDEHPMTLTTMHNLATVCEGQIGIPKAEQLFTETVKKRTLVLGPKHPETMLTKAMLADVFRRQNRFQEAQQLYKDVLVLQTEFLGPNHPHTVVTKHDLAVVYQSLLKYEQAEEIYRSVLDEQKKHLGPEHLHTLTTMYNLAYLCNLQEKYQESAELYEFVVSERERQLGSKHEATLVAKQYLAFVYISLERYEEAESLLQLVVIGCGNLRGHDDPATIILRDKLDELRALRRAMRKTSYLIIDPTGDWWRRYFEQYGS